MLKRTLTAAEHTALAPEMQALYVAAADGNGFTLEVDADPAVRALQTQVGEFRENNVTLTRQMEELRANRLPPPESAALQEQVADLTRLVTERDERYDRLETARARDRFKIRISEIAIKCGVRLEAIPDMQSRAEGFGFRTEEDGTVAAFRNDAAVMSRRDPSVRLTATEWMQDQRKDGAGHLFKPSKGSGKPQDSTGVIIDGVLHNPSESEWGQNIEDIASGKVKVGDTLE